MADLDVFRQQTRDWLEENCPQSMRTPQRSDNDACWGGRNFTFASEDQKLWLERMAARGRTAGARRAGLATFVWRYVGFYGACFGSG
mgnify:CR=1 FL=1